MGRLKYSIGMASIYSLSNDTIIDGQVWGIFSMGCLFGISIAGDAAVTSL